MTELTAQQRRVLDFCVRQFELNGAFPTLREIAAAFEFASVRAVEDHLDALVRKGFVERRRGCVHRGWLIRRLPVGTSVVPRLVEAEAMP